MRYSITKTVSQIILIMKARYSLIFNRRNKLKDGKGLIHICVYFNRTSRKFIDTGIYVEPEFWNDKFKVVSPKHQNSVQINEFLRQQTNRIENFELSLINKNVKFDEQKLLEHLDNKSVSAKFSDFAMSIIEKSILSKATKNTHVWLVNLIDEFSPNLLVEAIDYNFINEFNYFLKHTKNLKVNSIGLANSLLRKFLNLAQYKDLIKDVAFRKFKIVHEIKRPTYLTLEQISKIENIDLKDNQDLEIVRDMFVFSCFTGLRFSDVKSLKMSDINSDGDELIIKKIQVKEKKKKSGIVTLDLKYLFEGKPQKILEKYINKGLSEFIFETKSTISTISHPVRLICAMAGVTDKNITFHKARHSFATNMSMYIDTGVIKELLGHASLRTTERYTHPSAKHIRERLKKISYQ